jgi:DNA-binding winged helix-turn-helix (wHTH) protein/TolB-like protein/Flp pilus assembly protein TadD
MTLETNILFEFGRFRLDPAERLLVEDGRPVALTPKAFEILLVLIESKGKLLGKEDLMKRIWPDSFVEEANLTVNISALRKALGGAPDGQSFIVTVPRHGYRFVAPVTEVKGAGLGFGQAQLHAPGGGGHEPPPEPAPIAPLQVVVPDVTGAKRTPRFLAAVTLLAVLGLGIAVSVYFARRQQPARKASETPRSLAVLPFQNLRQDPASDFLGYSLADAVITKLDYISALTVRPSYAVQKYRNQTIDLPKVAADLNVDTLLTGNFMRDGEDLRITSQLVDVRTDKILWRNSFDLKYDKLLTVQDNVAQQIIKGLELNLSPSEVERLKPEAPIDPVAYEYYLRGVDLYSRSDFPLAIKMLEKSAELSPNHALTWAYLGRSYTANASFQFGGHEQYRKAQEAFERALALQPTQIEARIYMANFLTDTGHAEQAVPLLREALRANPNHAEVHWELGYAYRFGGMLKESALECERARELDPGVKLNSSALNAYLYMGEYDKFLNSLPKSNEHAFPMFYRGFVEYYKKDWDRAAQDFNRAFELEPLLFQAQLGKALSYSIARQEEKGLEILRDTEAKINQRGVGDPESIYKAAQAYAILGDKASALRVLRRSIENGFFSYPYFENDPLVADLRNSPEFQQLMQVARQRHEAFKNAFF